MRPRPSSSGSRPDTTSQFDQNSYEHPDLRSAFLCRRVKACAGPQAEFVSFQAEHYTDTFQRRACAQCSESFHTSHQGVQHEAAAAHVASRYRDAYWLATHQDSCFSQLLLIEEV